MTGEKEALVGYLPQLMPCDLRHKISCIITMSPEGMAFWEYRLCHYWGSSSPTSSLVGWLVGCLFWVIAGIKLASGISFLLFLKRLKFWSWLLHIWVWWDKIWTLTTSHLLIAVFFCEARISLIAQLNSLIFSTFTFVDRFFCGWILTVCCLVGGLNCGHGDHDPFKWQLLRCGASQVAKVVRIYCHAEIQEMVWFLGQ